MELKHLTTFVLTQIALFLILLSSLTVSAEELSTQEPDTKLLSSQQEISPNHTCVSEKNENQGFSMHKANYVLPRTWSDTEIDDRQGSEIKFQISVKQEAAEYLDYRLYFAYSQQSHWQAYDSDNSSPFRETNYNPEIFFRSPDYAIKWGHLGGDFGYEHQSNGSRVPISKSWDRFYLRFRFMHDFFFAEYKIWYRIPEKEKEDPADPEGDDNPDIHEYYGYSELFLRFTIDKAELGIFGRFNGRTEKGAVQIDLTYPAPGNAALWYIQYWNGYGESLIDYNQTFIKLGLGIMVKR